MLNRAVRSPYNRRIIATKRDARASLFLCGEGIAGEPAGGALQDVVPEAGEDVGLATIYRVLTQFEEAGLVDRHHFEGGHSVFEIKQEQHHDHLVCIKCGAVEEFVDPLIEARQLEIARNNGFEMTDHSLNIYGVCAQCQ